MVLAGSDAMDSMSMERGFVHWHGDVDATDAPVEAGIGFACRSDGADYVGKEAVMKQVRNNSEIRKASVKHQVLNWTGTDV